ncbi:MAG: 4a-hydroxytetrahydrobiopterin dehydratase, partial [Bacteroidota bacterium]
MSDRAPLSDADVDAALADLDGWTRDGTSIVRQLELGDFREAFAFLTRVAFEAEAVNHHPEISNV